MGNKNKGQRPNDVDTTEDDELDTEQLDDEDDDEETEEQGSEDDQEDEDEDDDAGFEGEFDPKRARRTITNLRNALKAEKAKKGSPKDTVETKRLSQENLRLRVALKAGLDDDLADRLRGETEEELLEDAQKLLDRFYPEKEQEKAKPRQPQARLKGGTKPNEEPELTADKVVAQALGR